MRILTLEDFVSNILTEEKLLDTITNRELKNQKKYNPVTREIKYEGEIIQAYIKVPHFDLQYNKRFITGEDYINAKGNLAAKKFNELENWKPVTQNEFTEILRQGINKIITQFGLGYGAYHIISESTRMIIPIANIKVEKTNKKALIISSIFHTYMTNIDVFKWKNKSYDKDDVLVEQRSWNDFLNYIVENEGINLIEGLGIELIVENGKCYPNSHVVVI